MSDQTAMLTGTIDDYLLGIADGLQKAQAQLSQVSLVLQKDEAPITYQIPRVDFELKLSFEMVLSDDGTDTKMLRFRTPGGQSGGSRQSTTEATSTIKGAFVAVPRLAGKPHPIIRTTLRRIDRNKMEVRVTIVSAAGEKLPGVQVHFNVDRDQSRLLTESLGSLGPEVPKAPGANTRFWDGVVETDERGIAIGVLDADPKEPSDKYVAAVVDVLGQTETIVLRLD